MQVEKKINRKKGKEGKQGNGEMVHGGEERRKDDGRGEEKRGENVRIVLSEVLVLMHNHLSMTLGAAYWLQNLINCGQLH